ncbi:histidinol phosphate phosphatase H [Exidia glandulosa HHB12029]|uniref:Histidinol-phosphatase n=1 Tax=Exidia glandulosa HHB12029 TaxID=1314781 RepID=A0A165IF47_EXIGL|nr:histidinol phosphate phosphatase H [Exidia glandulosa HHB12029]
MHSHHSHSGQFCKHAKGQLEDVVKAAIARGFTTYGLTEHVPRYRVQDLYPEESDTSLDALYETFTAFVKEARRLQHAYADKITLLVGLETENITPDDLDRLERLLVDVGGVDYVVGSVHHVNSIPIDFDEATFQLALATASNLSDQPATSSKDAMWEQLTLDYLDAQYELMQRVKPQVIGHFDLCRLYNPSYLFSISPTIWSKVERNVKYAISYGALFEANAAAFRKGWKSAYPGPDVAKLILELGGRFVLSDDSHGPHAVGLNYNHLRQYLIDIGVRKIWHLVPTENEDGTRAVKAVRTPGVWSDDPFWSKQGELLFSE